MAGYSRQSFAQILDGLEITAPPLNAEFNQLEAAFNKDTGHAHDGTIANGPRINLGTSVTGFLPDFNGGNNGRNRFDGVTNPVNTSDSIDGYQVGSLWFNSVDGGLFLCVDATPNAAVWRILPYVAESQIFLGPKTTDPVEDNENNPLLSGAIYYNTVDEKLKLYTGEAWADAVFSVEDLVVRVEGNIANETITGSTFESGTIEDSAIGTTTPAPIRGTTIEATEGLTGDLTGNVTGDLTGNVTGDLTGNVTGDVTGDITANLLLVNGEASHSIVSVASSSIDCSLGNYFTATVSSNTTYSFINPPASRAYGFTIEVTHTSGTITWPTSVRFPDDKAPSLTTGKTHLFMFITDDGGTRWRGAFLENYQN
jgi:hypothetical protein